MFIILSCSIIQISMTGVLWAKRQREKTSWVLIRTGKKGLASHSRNSCVWSTVSWMTSLILLQSQLVWHCSTWRTPPSSVALGWEITKPSLFGSSGSDKNYSKLWREIWCVTHWHHSAGVFAGARFKCSIHWHHSAGIFTGTCSNCCIPAKLCCISNSRDHFESRSTGKSGNISFSTDYSEFRPGSDTNYSKLWREIWHVTHWHHSAGIFTGTCSNCCIPAKLCCISNSRDHFESKSTAKSRIVYFSADYSEFRSRLRSKFKSNIVSVPEFGFWWKCTAIFDGPHVRAIV